MDYDEIHLWILFVSSSIPHFAFVFFEEKREMRIRNVVAVFVSFSFCLCCVLTKKNAKAVYELPEGILVIEKDGTPVLYEQEEYEPQSVDSPSRITPSRHSSRSKTSSPLVSGRQPSTPSSSRRSLKQPLRDESTPGRNSLKSAPQHASAPPQSTFSNSFSPKSRSVPSVLDRDLSTVSEV